MTCTLFISDLHLERRQPATTRLFLEFLHTQARAADALYILGDLFEAWIGDEDLGDYRDVIEALRACTDSGTHVRFMPGNRDFLVGGTFASATGCRLLDDPARIELHGVPVLLTHGDALCTDDRAYQRFRCQVRDSRWQRAFLNKPVAERRRIVTGYREASREQARLKHQAVLDVNSRAVVSLMSAHRVSVLVHGHVHRQATHALSVDGRPARRLVLGNWGATGSVLECAAGAWGFRKIVPDAAASSPPDCALEAVRPV